MKEDSFRSINSSSSSISTVYCEGTSTSAATTTTTDASKIIMSNQVTVQDNGAEIALSAAFEASEEVKHCAYLEFGRSATV
jgi:NifU-like protein involved in Fe-S cluster formation